MSFSDHKITAFTHKIADLPDQPNLPADELKARFDSSPEELRTAHNAVCDDAQTLSDKVESIITQTFEGTIDREMLSDELAAELDGMADGIDALEESVAQKCEAYFGTYTGDGTNGRHVNVGFPPKAVIGIDPLSDSGTSERVTYCAIALQNNPIDSHFMIDGNGFKINRIYTSNECLNAKNHEYAYIAFK